MKSREFELKVEIEPDALKLLMLQLKALDIASKPRKDVLTSIYFDTADHRLRQHAMSLRIRNAGDSYVQTVKSATGVKGGISSPEESEIAVKTPSPRLKRIADDAAKARLQHIIGKRDLLPVFQTEVTRTTHDLAFNGSTATLSIDRGAVRSPAGDMSICEAELEFGDGSLVDFLVIALKAFKNVPLRFAQLNKAERGYGLLGGGMPPLVPAKAEEIKLSKKQSTAAAFRAISGNCVTHIIHNWTGLLSADDPEFAHQLRIGVRRLRVALAMFRPAIDGLDLELLAENLKDVGRIASQVRDDDVLRDDLVKPVLERFGEHPGAEALRQATAQAARESLRAVRDELGSGDWTPFLLKLVLLPHGVGWDVAQAERRKAQVIKSKALDKLARKVRRHSKSIATMSVEERHTLRKDLKNYRYGIELFAPLLPKKRTADMLAELRPLQDVFGRFNDAALVRRLPQRSYIAEGAVDMANAAWLVVGWHAADVDDAFTEVDDSWKAFRRSRPAH